MKRKDIALIVVIAVISGIVSFVVSGKLFASPSNRHQTAEVVPAIDPTFPTPNSKYFNSQAIDPTQLIQIGNTSNANPFNGSSQ